MAAGALNPRRLQPVHRFVAAVTVPGLGLLAVLAASSGLRVMRTAPVAFWIFSLFVFVGELFPIRVPRAGEVEEITTSTTFGFAVLLAYGTAPAAVVFALASALGDSVHRKPVWKIAFNVAQYAFMVSAAGAVYSVSGGTHRIVVSQVGAIALAALAMLVVNDVVTGIAIALAQRVSVVRYIGNDLAFQLGTTAALCAMSPIVIVAANAGLWLMPLLAAPTVAVYWAAAASVENTRLVARLEESLAHMTELNHMKDEFVAVVSHELRTPLTSIQGYIKTLLQLPGDLGEEQRRSFLEAADRQGDRLRRLIEQLLVVARLESHVEPLTLTSVSLQSLARHVAEELRPRAHGHTFDIRVDPNLEPVSTDEAKLHQILSNLIENALKYSPPDTRVIVRGEPVGDGVVVSVHDEGPGIPLEAHEKVFERFYQVDSSATRAVGGTGLGLYICRRMADTLGARLWLERSDERGSVFNLWLPGSPPGDRPAPPAEAEPSSSAPSRTPAVSR